MSDRHVKHPIHKTRVFVELTDDEIEPIETIQSRSPLRVSRSSVLRAILRRGSAALLHDMGDAATPAVMGIVSTARPRA